jgi:hypothetical protein
MHVSSRLQCAVIAVALMPCWVLAQSGSLGNATTDVSSAGSQLSAAPVATTVDIAAQQQGNTADGGVAPLPSPNITTDPIPSAASDPATDANPDNQSAATSGPTSSSAAAGIRSQAATDDLSRQELARRNLDQDGGRRGIGRDAVLMIVGGAAVVAGALVGGTAGTALIIVGAVIGITGLVLILSR